MIVDFIFQENIFGKSKKRGRVVLSFLLCFALITIAAVAILSEVMISSQENIFAVTLFYILPILYGFLAVLLVTPLIIRLATKLDFLDHPTERKTHKKPVALLGGVAIFLGIFGCSFLYGIWTSQITAILIGGVLLLIVGTIDDIYPLSSGVRLIVQLAASLIVMSSGLVVSFAPDALWGQIMGSLITIIWILGITNAFNFSDGVDGLAGGIALISSIFFFLISLQLGQLSLALMAAITAGCSLGFLCYNFKPAKIYLGDGGATFLGFLLACFALYGGWSDRGFVIALGIPALILGVLIYDMCYITISRIKNGLIHNLKEWLDFTGKDHFHHRLMHLGFKEQYAVLFIYGICIILGLSALTLANVQNTFGVLLLVLQAGLIFTLVTMLMLAGRKLYMPKNIAKKVLSNDQVPFKELTGFVSGDTLKKMLDGKYDDEGKKEIHSILDEYIKEEKQKREKQGTGSVKNG